MAIHPKKVDSLRRRHEPLGHIKLTLDQLDDIYTEWGHWCLNVSISLGDGLTADSVADLKYAKKSELAHLVIYTEDPSVVVFFHKNKAELSYYQYANEISTINDIRMSLRHYKIVTPFYRLRGFWWWIYLLGATGGILTVRAINEWTDPLWPYIFPVVALAVLTVWLVIAIYNLRKHSSTRIRLDTRLNRFITFFKNLPKWYAAVLLIVVGAVLGKYLG